MASKRAWPWLPWQGTAVPKKDKMNFLVRYRDSLLYSLYSPSERFVMVEQATSIIAAVAIINHHSYQPINSSSHQQY
jgi:hypothetical protein